MKIHKEGFLTIPITFVITVLVVLLTYQITWRVGHNWALYSVIGLGVVLNALVINFFRNPDIQVNLSPNGILAPCDGKVVVIEKVFDSIYFKQEVLQISIFMSPLNVHVNRTPIGGVVAFFKYLPGKFLVAWHPKSSTENEQTFTVVKNEQHEVAFKQIAGGLARRIKWYIQAGDKLAQGQEFGFIKFGSRMDILIPDPVTVSVQLGQKTQGGTTIIAQFV